jgi:hypothetical protein
MAQTIQIKRSTSTTTPSSLSAGELAYSGKSDSNKLFIGHPDGTTGPVAIGGQYYTGVIDGAASANTAGKLVVRDGSGNFSAGTITANITGNVSGSAGTVTSISGHDTDDLSEGSTNLYYTNARARGAISVGGNLSYNSSTGVISYTTPTMYADADARGAISVTDAGGLGSASYNNSTGVITYTGPSNGDIRGLLSASGDLSYNSTTGVISFSQAASAVTSVNSATGAVTLDTDDIAEGSSNLYYTDARTDTRVDTILKHSGHSNITVADGADGKLVLTAASQYGNSDARGAISVTDSGGDGSLSYNNSTGVITYTGPSASEVRAHISAGTGVGVSNGAISIGQAVATTSNVTFNNVTVDGTLSSDDITAANMTASGNVIVTGNLTVNGTTTTVNSNTVAIGDAIMTLNSDETGTPSANAGLEVERGTATNVSLLWNETNDNWTVSDGSATSVLLTAANFNSVYTGTIDGGSF